MRSLVWQYFVKLDDYMSQCLFCKRQFSYRSSVSNLRKHYNRTHRKDYGELEDVAIEDGHIIIKNKKENIEETENEESSGHKSDNDKDKPPRTKLTRLKSLEDYINIKENSSTSFLPDSKDEDDDETFWNFIEYSKGKAYCSICKEPLPRRGADLKRHISIYHPDHAANSNTNSDNEAIDKNAEEASGDIFTEVIYLEDHGQPADNNGPIRIRNFSKPKKPHKYVTAKPYERIPKLERTHNAVNSTNDIGKNNNLEDFTRYILSLLKALPQHATNKLQLDIINMILKAKMEHEAPVLSLPVTVSTPATEHASVSYVVNEVSNQPSSPNLMINMAAAET